MLARVCDGDKDAKVLSKCFLHSPHDHLMAALQTQALHTEHHSLQHARQRVGEGNLGCHFLAHDGFSHGLPGKSKSRGKSVS